MSDTDESAAFDEFGDLADGIAMPMVGARFIAGLDADGQRASNFQVHFDDHTVTPMEVVGLVMVSVWEWMHGILHEDDE